MLLHLLLNFLWRLGRVGALDHPNDGIKLFRLHEDLASLRSFGWTNNAAGFHEIHQAAGLGKANAQLALQHGSRAQLGGDNQLDGFEEVIHILANFLIDFLLGLGLLFLSHALGIVRCGLGLGGIDDGHNLII